MTDSTEKVAKIYKLLRDLNVPDDDAFYVAVELVRICCPPEKPAPAKSEAR